MVSRSVDRRSVWRCMFCVMPQGRQDRTWTAFSMTFARRFLIETLKSDMHGLIVILATTSDIMNFSRNSISALNVIARENMIPVTDFLHLSKNFCNKVKSHPELLEDILICQDFESFLDLGNVFPINCRSAGCAIHML
jgi:hypothetical protein